jgi:hypothetical protein
LKSGAAPYRPVLPVTGGQTGFVTHASANLLNPTRSRLRSFALLRARSALATSPAQFPTGITGEDRSTRAGGHNPTLAVLLQHSKLLIDVLISLAVTITVSVAVSARDLQTPSPKTRRDAT